MNLKDNPYFKLPQLMAGAFSGMDRLTIPYNLLILREVLQRDDNGNIELVCQAQDGPEQKRGSIVFSSENRSKKNQLYLWLSQMVGNNIQTIYGSDFNFEEKKLCPKCSNEIFKSFEPKIINLANAYSTLPLQNEYRRCSNEKCDYRERI